MSFDKEKLRRAAEKNLAQGKIQAAIKDYCKLSESDPRDYNTLNTLGDLYVRVSSKEKAIECFDRIADYYDTQGFTHKAIAMYKKIGRLKPDDFQISAKLAPLYQALGLVAEARTHFITVAEAYQKSGERLSALEIWQQIADLDPNDTKTQLNLAESLIKENQLEKAANAFTEAGARLFSKNRIEEALNAFNRALSINSSSLTALSGATEAHISLGFPDEAVEKLEKAKDDLREQPEYYSLLAKCYLELENLSAAENALVDLIEREPASYYRLLDVTRLYIKTGNLESAINTLEVSAEHLLSNNQEQELEFWVNEILTRNPEHLRGLKMLARLRSWQRNEPELKDVLERLAEAARLNESFEEERNALSELRLLFPQEKRYLDRLQELGVETSAVTENNTSGADNNSIPTFETFATFADESEVYLQPQYAQENEPQFETFGNSTAFVEAVSQFEQQTIDFQSYEAVTANNEAAQVSDFEFVSSPNKNESSFSNIDSQLNQELESVDFYIAEGYNDLAVESLDVIEKQFGFHPQIQLRREKLQPQDEADFDVDLSSIIIDKDHQQQNEQPFAVETQPQVKSVNSVNPTFADIFEEMGEDMEIAQVGSLDTADYETHYNLGLAYKEMGLYDDAVEEFQNAVKMVSPGDGTSRYLQICNLIGHCFVEKGMPDLAVMWYQRGLNAPGHTEEEYQALRFELGMAYEKSGETEKAIAQFTEIYAFNVAYRGVGEKLRLLQAVS